MVKKNREKPRVRFAPAPTGPLHMGGARTALFNYLFAKKQQGSFILRLEDTDLERSKTEFEKDILEGLSALGLMWDEGPVMGTKEYQGKFGPYRQSERGAIYQPYLQRLLEEEKAYHCFCSPQELKNMRTYQISQGQPPGYPGKCRSLSKKEAAKRIAEGREAVVRFRSVAQKLTLKDLVRGKVEFNTAFISDFALARIRREKVLPLYNFAATIDDFKMKISHVIRGEDHLPNTPKQILLQKALDLPQPEYAHLPLILGEDRSKLSKRHGSVALTDYQKAGYLPEALLNFIAFLGWNPGKEREIFSLASLVKEFSLERVQKAGAVFNLKKLDFLNGYYIRQLSLKKLTEECLPYLIAAGLIRPCWNQKELLLDHAHRDPSAITGYEIRANKERIEFEQLKQIVGLYQERLKKLSEISSLTDFFFKKRLVYNRELLSWQGEPLERVSEVLSRLEKTLKAVKTRDWKRENLEDLLLAEAEKVGDRGRLLWPLRVALSGKKASAPSFEIAELLGKEKTLKRLEEARALIGRGLPGA